MKQISILGCGWLGLPLAKSLLKDGIFIKGSTTSVEKLQPLFDSGIDPYLLQLGTDNVPLDSFLSGSETVIINIPPQIRQGGNVSFVQKINSMIPYLESAGINNVLFVSSTSVYTDDNSIVTEETSPNPQTESAKQLLEVEELLKQNPNFRTTIVRFGGLIGGDRHPVKQLSGRTDLPNPDAAVNLIHREDCIGVIHAIKNRNVWGHIFNAVYPDHPTRQQYYRRIAAEWNLPLPEFQVGTSIGKVISSAKAQSILGYDFKFPI